MTKLACGKHLVLCTLRPGGPQRPPAPPPLLPLPPIWLLSAKVRPPEKAVRWLSPVCPEHRLAPRVWNSFRLTSVPTGCPGEHLPPARSKCTPPSASPPHLGLASHLENDLTTLQDLVFRAFQESKKALIYLAPIKYKALNANRLKKSPPHPSKVDATNPHFTYKETEAWG